MIQRREQLVLLAAATFLAAASSASAEPFRPLVGTVTTPPRVLAAPPSFRAPAHWTPPHVTPSRIPGASYTLNPWGPARFGSAVPQHQTRCSAPVRLVPACAPRPSCSYVGWPSQGHWHGHDESTPSLFVSAAGGGVGVSLAVGLPCGCRSVRHCSHR